MCSRSWQLRVQDILTAIAGIQSRTTGMSFDEFAANETVVKAVLYDFVIIGEASRNIPVEIQSRQSLIPWRLIGDTRNVMAHEYFQVELEIIWDGIQNDLPPLVSMLQGLLAQDTAGEL